ncbi:DNA polymerase Y family protein [Accumulibacter sp.]|uniref:Y-family DNA polymerase n=1 Tax=Accumulibacter sp. TaxID=2053492 RepID=UPI0025FF4F11|nr:DNA polymerase Y family protein [Accumulibacter sp.]MCP5229030.1 DNA polymerase Y family protein [Accumulibacter sp.]
MLWLVLYLPRLPLEVFPSLPSPSAIISRERIVVADQAAASAGVMPGLRLAEAWAFLPTLAVQERDIEREQAALTRLACWAGGFTSEICCLPPRTLLLEVAASLRLFGGAAVLFERVVAGCAEQGFVAQAALAPTPLAAQWLALAGDDMPCLEVNQLPQRLGRLPLAVLDLSRQNQARLRSFGTRLLGDVLRLPRAGLARRLGAAFVADLARALGELPDPRARFVFPERFAERLELPARIENAIALGFAGRRLIATLCGWLAARAGGISECCFEFAHEGVARPCPATVMTLGFGSLTRDPERITRVLVERLQRLELPTAVESISLRAEALETLPGRTSGLFGKRDDGAGGDSLAALVERLQARLGNGSVHALSTVAEHRPENASRAVPANLLAGEKSSTNLLAASAMSDSGPGPRPLWLLARPQALREMSGRPQCAGSLRLLAGPERIESGWWDANEPDTLGDVRRDYFVALSMRGEWLWIFRCRRGWFLHGVFA